MTSLFKCRRLYTQIPWVNVPNIASRSPWGFLDLIAISHFVHLKYTQWRHDIIHTFKPAKCVHLKVLIHMHMSVWRVCALFTFVFYCDVITHAWRRIVRGRPCLFKAADSMHMVHIAFYDSSDITDRGRMEIDCGLALGPVVGIVTMHFWSLWSRSCMVVWPTTPPGPKRWSISTIAINASLY